MSTVRDLMKRPGPKSVNPSRASNLRTLSKFGKASTALSNTLRKMS